MNVGIIKVMSYLGQGGLCSLSALVSINIATVYLYNTGQQILTIIFKILH